LQNLFTYTTDEKPGMQPSHEGGGELMPTGMRPKFTERFAEMGLDIDPTIFGVGQMFNNRR
jgi:pilus assembly protein CpaF